MAAVGILLMLLTGGWFVLDGHFYYLKVTKLGLDEFRPLRGRRVVPWTSIRTTSFDKVSKYLTLHTIASGSIRISPVVRGFTTVVDYIVANTPASVHQPGVQALQKDPNQWLSQ